MSTWAPSALEFWLPAPILPRINDPSPVGSQFETAEEAEAYLRWLKAKVAESLADDRPVIEHDEAMKRVRALIKAKGRND